MTPADDTRTEVQRAAADRIGRVGVWTFTLDTQPWSQAADTAAEIESLGYRAIWVPETVGRDALVNSTLILGATRTIGVATGIASIYGRDAVAMACGQKAVAEAFPGRFLLGLGVSHAPMVQGLRGHSYEKPVETMRAYLEKMDASPYMAAAPQETPPRVLAALGPRMIGLARDLAAGVHNYLVPPEHTAYARERLGPGPVLAPEQAVCFAADAEEGRRIARGHLRGYLRLPNYVNNLRRLGFSEDDIAGEGSDRLVDAIVAWGDEEAIAARVRGHLDAGADHVCIQVLGAQLTTVPVDDWRRLAPAVTGL
ncbi:MAG TPA: LLM class F420-dependent oxidoreductase [Acidimicrobiales bacterium]|nr:LLM class F420-dependent oxidoreductase [Acidimicrobiales bacterium]